MTVTIRPARPGDEHDILRLIRALADYEREPDAVEATAEGLRSHLFGGEPQVFAHVAEGDDTDEGPGGVVGIAVWFVNFSTWTGRHGIYLEDLYVRQQYRGRGYGEQLLRRLAGIALERDCGRLEWSVLDWNHRAIEFYKSLGAAPMNEWTTYRVTGPALERRGASAANDSANDSERE